MADRQTAFPGIIVDSIEIEQPPFDEPGVIQDFVGRGMISEFEVPKRAADFTEDTVGEKIKRAEEMIGPLRDTYRIKYNLQVRVVPTDVVDAFEMIPDKFGIDPLVAAHERVVSARARAFTRAKNPFEPDVIEIRTPSKNIRMSNENIENIYDVTTAVTK